MSFPTFLPPYLPTPFCCGAPESANCSLFRRPCHGGMTSLQEWLVKTLLTNFTFKCYARVLCTVRQIYFIITRKAYRKSCLREYLRRITWPSIQFNWRWTIYRYHFHSRFGENGIIICRRCKIKNEKKSIRVLKCLKARKEGEHWLTHGAIRTIY